MPNRKNVRPNRIVTVKHNFSKHKQFVIFWLAHKMLMCFENYRLSVIGGNTKLNQVIEGPQN